MSIEEQKKLALEKLQELRKEKLTIPRHVFFVPGWSSESCGAWLEPYTPENVPMRQWLESIVLNWQEKAHFVTFATEESKKCRSFIDFGKILREKIEPYIKDDRSKLDLIGHSMGGLDISAAVINNFIPSEKVENIITLGSPFHGSEWGQMMRDLSKLSWLFLGGWVFIRAALMAKGYSYYHVLQLENMNPKGKSIIDFNTKENRIKLLNSVSKLYTFFGTDDTAVKESALFNGFGIDNTLLEAKLKAVCIEGATHSGQLGLPQDPEVVLNILNIISA
mgnify:CR=1 FL=1